MILTRMLTKSRQEIEGNSDDRWKNFQSLQSRGYLSSNFYFCGVSCLLSGAMKFWSSMHQAKSYKQASLDSPIVQIP